MGAPPRVDNRRKPETFLTAAGSVAFSEFLPIATRNTRARAALSRHLVLRNIWEPTMGRYALLWLLGVPIPILLLIYLFGGLH